MIRRRAGDVVFRCASTPHRLEIDGNACVTLFLTGPKVRAWGFHCPQGWKHHRDYVANAKGVSTVGAGCD